MTINAEDVKVYESQRLTDEDDGGGRATGREVIDGNINNLFPDISRLDRTVGDVALRKAFVGIATDNSDTYLGAHAIVVEPPTDPRVNVVMFDAGSESDQRETAQSRIESYVVRGAAAQWWLLGNQYEGQRQLVGYQREEQPIPEVGEVFLLDDTDEEQYFRITEVAHDVQTFTVASGAGGYTNFDRRRLDLGISAPLDFTFEAPDPKPEGPTGTYTKVNSTEVADAARYWGVSRSVDPAVIGDVGVTVASIYSSLVPSAQLESPLLDQQMGLQSKDIRPAAAGVYSQAITAQYITTTMIRAYLIRPAIRESVSLVLGGSTYLDDGTGILARVSGSNPFATLTLEHSTGLILGTKDSGTGSADIVGTADFIPGGVFSGKPLSLGVDVTLANRGFNWIRTFPGAKPRPGTTVVSFMALGKWYDLIDPGNGVLEGAGTGTVNFTTGTISITTEALPDVDTTILFSFIIDLADDTDEHSGTIATIGGSITVQCDPGMKPGTVVVTHTAGAVPLVVDDSVDTGVLAGPGGEGFVDYGTGIVILQPLAMPDDGTDITVDYEHGGFSEYIIASPAFNAAGVLSGTIPNAPLEPGSVTMQGLVTYSDRAGIDRTRLHSMIDDGVGGVKYGLNSSYSGDQGVGVINYATGAFDIELLHEWGRYVRTYSSATNYNTVWTGARELSAGPITMFYAPANPTAAVGQVVAGINEVTLDLLPGNEFANMIPGSLMFEWGGVTFIDRDGQIYDQFDSTTGAARSVGSVDYNDQVVNLNTWAIGSPLGVNVLAMQTVNDLLAVDEITFRTPGKPIRPQSMSITITDNDGNVISEVADVAGAFNGASVVGQVNVETGICRLQFTDGVDPVFVYQDSGRYNAVLFSFLPLDAELIGLNPVRLPSDGRVPVYREGDVVVMSHSIDTDAGTPTAGQAVALSRDHQASILVEDSNGLALDPLQFTANKTTGIVTFATPLTLVGVDLITPMVPPMNIKDRVEHMTVVNDVQITGELSFISPMPHDFPADETIVSSAIVWGDINSRVFSFFSQRTWNSGSPNWTDDRIGDDTTAQFNNIDWPVEYANRGAVTEKWAIVFRSSSSFDIVGQELGIIGQGSINVDLAPINGNTGFPYFVMRAAGWGGGWANGNVIRFNSDGCLAPLWIARTVLSGVAQEDDDQFTLQIRGDAD